MSEISSSEFDLAAARAGDDAAFTRLVKPLHGELHAHCYRMLGSAHDADDALQDALLRAWRGLSGFEGRSSLRSWLYTVATRTCLDLAEGRARRALPMDYGEDTAWLGPYPDARYEQREAVELAFVAALQHLPGNQRAALLLFDVLGFSAAEIAEVMATSTASVNSALQRARAIVSDRIPEIDQQQTLRKIGDARVREIVAAYAGALERGDADALLALVTEDVTWSMPPMTEWYAGVGPVLDFAARVPLSSCGSWRHVPVTANGQPAVAFYLRRDDDGPHRAWSITVLTLRDDRIAALTSFLGGEHFARFDLPATA
ncbi:sigma-70 family RNA polymerase sigma factor [Kutzneria sp. CA-103260]|uniref:sigma-70 family RNA polymerase sigma factor n=1 Tax=Kutzneria sp. CA-103260 TaxID=2802641 RepID=UPI001BAC2D30|nr:sigma-70 family RNA polymerase sigma factor [Kutzneria sp. CA-103260]QUQ66466.1 RNA polymerase factor sigma-70 [Kutzneria sp. CA-103260]